MQLGASLPVGDIGTGPTVLRDYAQAAEGLGYTYLLGARPRAGRQPQRRPRRQARRHHGHRLSRSRSCCSPSWPASRRRWASPSGVLILAQRQAALVAKQAACLDELCEGRFRLGIGVGWNEIEFQGLGMDFHTRGKRSAEQVRFMQALWAEPQRQLQGRVPPARRRRHQSAAEVGPRADLVRRPCRGDLQAHRQVRRRLHAAAAIRRATTR